jgi:hypothetical protein
MGLSASSRALEPIRPRTKLARSHCRHLGGNLQIPFGDFAKPSIVAKLKRM